MPQSSIRGLSAKPAGGFNGPPDNGINSASSNGTGKGGSGTADSKVGAQLT